MNHNDEFCTIVRWRYGVGSSAKLKDFRKRSIILIEYDFLLKRLNLEVEDCRIVAFANHKFYVHSCKIFILNKTLIKIIFYRRKNSFIQLRTIALKMRSLVKLHKLENTGLETQTSVIIFILTDLSNEREYFQIWFHLTEAFGDKEIISRIRRDLRKDDH